MGSNFKKLVAAHFFVSSAFEMLVTVLGWQMYLLTKDPLFLGMIGLVGAIPALSLALFSGHIVDRNNPLIIYRGIILLFLTCALAMFVSQTEIVATHSVLGIRGSVLALFVSAFLTGVASSFSSPSLFSLAPRLAKREETSKNSAWMAISIQGSRITGPAVGGIVFGFLGLSGIAITIGVILGFALLLVLLIELPGYSKTKSEKEPIRKNLLSGAKYVFRHPILLPAMSLDMLSVMFGGVTALLPIYAVQVLMIGPAGLGFLRAAPAIGAVLISVWMAKFNYRTKAGPLLFSAVTGFGVSILVFALSKNYALSFLALFLSGAFDSVSMVIRIAIMQLYSPDKMRGKISAVNSIFTGASNELGEFESGVAAKFLGAVSAALLGGVVCIATVVMLAFMAPKLRGLNLNESSNVPTN